MPGVAINDGAMWSHAGTPQPPRRGVGSAARKSKLTTPSRARFRSMSCRNSARASFERPASAYTTAKYQQIRVLVSACRARSIRRRSGKRRRRRRAVPSLASNPRLFRRCRKQCDGIRLRPVATHGRPLARASQKWVVREGSSGRRTSVLRSPVVNAVSAVLNRSSEEPVASGHRRPSAHPGDPPLRSRAIADVQRVGIMATRGAAASDAGSSRSALQRIRARPDRYDVKLVRDSAPQLYSSAFGSSMLSTPP